MLLYYSEKANVVANALSRKAVSMGSLACLEVAWRPMAREVQTFSNSLVRLTLSDSGRVLASVEAKSSLLDEVNSRQFGDAKLSKIHDQVLRGETKDAILDDKGVLRIRGRVCVPQVDDIIKIILSEAHSLRYSIHPRVTKMYYDLKHHY